MPGTIQDVDAGWPTLGVARVLVADRDHRHRAAVRGALDGHGFIVCAEAADADSAIAAARAEEPDVALVDVALPGNGIHAAREMRAVPGLAVVMLTASRSEQDVLDSVRAGAWGYLLKETPVSRLPTALEAVMHGEAAMPRALVGTLLAEIWSEGDRQHRVKRSGGIPVSLTAREWEVLQLLATGCTTAQMAERLFIAKATVRTHIATTLHKLGAPDRESARRLLGL